MKVNAHIAMTLIALTASALAAIARSPQPALAEDEIAAVPLAEWIRDRRKGLLVIDTRSADAIAQERLPGARALASVDLATLKAVDTVVVYADNNVAAGVVDVLQRQSATPRYLRLRGGLTAWNDEVLFPVVRNDASTRQRQQFIARAQLSRYFGGTPRRLEPGISSSRIRSRRGC